MIKLDNESKRSKKKKQIIEYIYTITNLLSHLKLIVYLILATSSNHQA